jgi:hypothetical protein
MRLDVGLQCCACVLVNVDVWLQNVLETNFNSSRARHKTSGSTAVRWLG